MKRFKRIIASLTAAAMISSLGLYSVQAEGNPEAVMKTVQYGASVLTGDYNYNGDTEEGASEYKWYISDTLLGEYTPIDGETNKTLYIDPEYMGSYVKFGVVPKDSAGTAGEEAISNPVRVESGITEAFEGGSMPDSVDASKCAGGTVELTEDPTDSNNTALRLNRTDAAAGMSIFVYELPQTSENVIAVDADVMAASNIADNVAWDMMYMCQTATAPDWHAFKICRVGNNLAIVGSSENWNLTDKFTADEWHHIKLVIDKADNTILGLYFDGQLVCENMGFRFDGEFNGFFSYLNGAATGTGYYDNITVTEAKDYSGLSEADAELIDIGDTSAVQSDMTLPAEGTTNGSTIAWESSDAGVIAPDGTVTRPSADEGDKDVTLTAHIVNGNNYITKDFAVTVKSESTEPWEAPTATAKTVQYGASVLTGDYAYSGDTEEGASEYKWYISDTLLGEYTPIDGETNKTLYLDPEYMGSYVKFGVVPKDSAGTAGAEAISNPVRVESGITEAFEGGSMPDSVDASKCAGGTVELTEDPTDSGNTALRLNRTDANAGMSIFVYELPQTSENVIAVDADVMAASNISSGVAWDMMYMCQTATAPDWHAFKICRVGNNLAIVGSSENWNLTDKFTADEWHHIKLVLDKADNTILGLYFDGQLVCENMGFRFDGEFNGFFSYLNGAATGTGYYDNITVTEAKDYSGLSEADAELIDIGDTSAVQSDMTLPTEGTTNGSTIAWESSDAGVIAPDGTVTRPSADEGDKDVTLTAHIVNGNNYITKDFAVTVKSESTEPWEAPTATAKTVQYGASVLTGDYAYSGDTEEGASEYKWYISDTLLGEYTPIDGETNKTLYIDPEYMGSYVKFGVVPKDSAGTAGTEAISNPVRVESGITEAFEGGSMPDSVDASKCAGGTVELTEDPTDSNNTALRLNRTDANAGMSIFVYELPQTSENVIAVDADVMAAGNIADNVAWDMMYMCQTATAPDWHAFKICRVGNNLAIVGSSENWNLTDKFTADEWHHIKLVLDKADNTILGLYFDGQLVCENMGFRFDGEFNGFFSYLNGAATGTGYYDNITVTEAKDYSGLSEADAELIDIGDTSAVQSDMTLPAEGTTNGSTIAWESSDTSVIAPDGTVMRPSADEGDKDVTLTAHIVNGNNYMTKEFTVHVLREAGADETPPIAAVQAVQYGASELTGAYTYESEHDVPEKDSVYAWYMSDSLLGNYSIIEGQNAKTLALSDSYSGKYVKFSVTPKDANGLAGKEVISNPVKIEAVAQDYTGYAQADAELIDLGDITAVKADLELPSAGAENGSEIIWVSSDESLISTDGTVDRPGSAEGDKSAVLTAYIIKGNDYVVKKYDVTVKCKSQDEEIPPTVNMKAVQYGVLEMTGDYEYMSETSTPEGESEYKWYVSDSMMGEYSQIEDAADKTLKIGSDYEGKYLKFSVTPKDTDGLVGTETMSNPIKVIFGTVDTFDEGSDISQTVDVSKCYGGTASIQQDPLDETNYALAMNRTSSDTNMSMVKYKFNPYNAENAKALIIDADVRVGEDIAGDKIWQTFYIGQSGTEVHVYKLYRAGRQLIARGGDIVVDGTVMQDVTIANTFTKGDWHHIQVAIDLVNKKVTDVYFNGELVQQDVPFRNDVDNINSVFSFTQDNTQGTTWIDNFRVTAIGYYDGLTERDANSIELGDTSALINDIELPTTGPVNGSEIAWTSSNEDLIKPDGTVTRPAREDGDQKVTLTAHLLNGNDYTEKTFEVTVMREINDEEIVQYDSRELMKLDGMVVDDDTELPSEGIYGAEYEWTSTDESIISSDGEVTAQSEKKDVQFNVKVSCGSYSDTKTVTLTVAPTISVNKIEPVRISASSQNSSTPIENVNDGDYTTMWSSLEADSAPYVIMDMGKGRRINSLMVADTSRTASSVSLKVSSDSQTWTDVALNGNMGGSNLAVISFDPVEARYVRIEFTPKDAVVDINEITVSFNGVDESAVSESLDKLELPVGSSVTNDFEVPSALEDGTEIEWSSSNTSVLRYDGTSFVVTRPSRDTSVTITAEAGGQQKRFTVIVKGTGTTGGGGSGSGGGSSSGGGGGNRVIGNTTNPVILPTETPQTTPEPGSPEGGFTDLGTVGWAKDAINDLADKGIVSGTSDTTFEPNRSITREEFAAIIYRAMGFDKIDAEGSFSDVDENAWYYDAVTQLYALGIINGIGDGKFGVGTVISRQDMAVMAHRAAEAAGAQLDEGELDFGDNSSIADYAKAPVAALVKAGVITGTDEGLFNPLGQTTRAESAVVVSRLLSLF